MFFASEVKLFEKELLIIDDRLLLAFADSKSRFGVRGQSLQYIYWEEGAGWSSEFSLNGLEQNLLRFNGFDLAQVNGGLAAVFSEKIEDERWTLRMTFAEKLGQSFQGRTKIIPSERLTTFPHPRVVSDGKNAFVLYNTQKLPMVPVEAPSVLGNLFLIRHEAGDSVAVSGAGEKASKVNRN